MIVVKYGGHAMRDESGLFAAAISAAKSQGVVVVHGGGPQIDRALSDRKIESEFVGGFRRTTPEIFTVVHQVLAQEIGPALAEHLVEDGIDATALSGFADHIIVARKLNNLVDGTAVDLGQVGEVLRINTEPLNHQLTQGKVVVLSPVAVGEDGQTGFNVNADLAAAAVAGALGAEQLIVMTDVPGIYEKWPDRSTLIAAISATDLAKLKPTFTQGMAPKVKACLDAIAAGARAVRIIDGTDPQSFEKALSGKGGTLVSA